MSKTNVAYVMYNDVPTSGLIKTQVLSLLRELKIQKGDLQLTLLAFWHPLVAWRYRKEIAELKTQLVTANIDVINVPFAVVPGRYFLDSSRLFPILYIWTLILFRIVLRRGYDIVHSRGYLAGHVSTKLAARYRFKTVFDMRSLWPKEHVSIGAWHPEDSIYRMWERIELETVEMSDVAVAQSRPMAEEVEKLGTRSTVTEIPICVDTDLFKPVVVDRDRLRTELGWSDNFVFGYHGSLGLKNRNIKEIASFFGAVNRSVPDSRLLILTSNRLVDIPAVMTAEGVEPGTYEVRHPKQQDIPVWFSAVDAGAHAMSIGPDSHTRMSVKVVEYFSCGLPVIVNPHVGGAAEIIEERGLGAVIDGSEGGTLIADELARIVEQRDSIGGLSREVAEQSFSVQACAKKYIAVYDSLVGPGTNSR